MYKPLSYGMKFARGSEWFALTRDFGSYLTAELKVQHSAMHEVWTDALLLYQPDETFFHTALLNSPFCGRHANRHLHYISAIVPEKIQHGGQDEIGTRSPAYLTQLDFKEILLEKAKRPVFFARKLDDATHEATINLCQQLDAQKGLASEPERHHSWPGLLDWLQEHLAKWLDLKKLPANESNESCSLDENADRAGACGLRLNRLSILSRTPPLPPSSMEGEAQRTDLRFTPETWLIKQAGQSSAKYRLVERFAVPPARTARAFGMALLVVRLGTGWSEEAERFTEHVSIVRSGRSGRSGKSLSLATYWAPHVTDVGDLPQVLADWGKCVVKQQMYDVHVWGSPLILPSCERLSPGIQRVRLKLQGGDKTVVLAWRDFLMFDRMEEVRLDQMRRFFELQTSSGVILSQRSQHKRSGASNKSGAIAWICRPVSGACQTRIAF